MKKVKDSWQAGSIRTAYSLAIERNGSRSGLGRVARTSYPRVLLAAPLGIYIYSLGFFF